MKHLLTLLCLSALCAGCGTKGGKHAAMSSTDTVLVVFDTLIPQGSLKLPSVTLSTQGYSYLSYMGKDGIPVFIEGGAIKDTLRLPTIGGYLEVAHKFNGIELMHFYLKGGDTVSFSYDSLNRPLVKSSLSSRLTEAYNFARNVSGAAAEAEAGLNPQNLYFIAPLLNRLSHDTILVKYHKPFIENYRRDLDAAEAAGTLDPTYLDYYEYQYRIENKNYLFYSLAAKLPRLSNGQFDVETARREFQDEGYLPNDSLTRYISYYSDPPKIVPVDFDAIASDTLLPPKSKMLRMFIRLRGWNIPGMGQKSPAQLAPYYETFLRVTGDTLALEKLKAEFSPLYVAPDNVKTGDMVLTGTDGATTTLDAVLARHLGKVVYVDFWASWCGPCVGGMPDALKLREEYKNKDIAFVYLAKGDSEEPWKDAIKTHRIDRLAENYLIVNHAGAELIVSLKIDLIPRYIIFDKTGKLVNPNAPRPNFPDIRKELDKYL